MTYNPLGLHIDRRDGVTRDKYGREFTFNENVFKRKRRRTVTPAYHASEVKK